MEYQNILPNWLDNRLYPFDNKYIQLPDGRMHYVDEGSGQVILFVHGTPAWSFLYRDFIKALSREYRCIAVDHLGFGLSERSEKFEGTPQAHADNLALLIRELDLREITFVVHDFGGPIGLGAALNFPDRTKKVVLFNSWLWETKNNKEVQKIDKVVKGALGRFLYLYLNISPKVLLKKGFDDPRKLKRNIHDHYVRPFPNKKSRRALLELARSLAGSSDWYEEQWQHLDKLGDKEWLILWGARDKFITPEFLEKWLGRLPQAKCVQYECGHFVQEEMTEKCIAEIAGFIG